MSNGKYSFSQISSGILVPILVIVAGLAAYFVLFPKYQTIQTVKSELHAAELDADQKRQALDDLKNLINDYERKEARLAPLGQALPESPDIPELLNNVQYLASQSGLQINGLEIAPAQTGSRTEEVSGNLGPILSATNNVEAITISGTFRGQYINLKTFVLNLEQNLRLMDVQELTLGKIDPESGLQDYVLKIQTYYQTK